MKMPVGDRRGAGVRRDVPPGTSTARCRPSARPSPVMASVDAVRGQAQQVAGLQLQGFGRIGKIVEHAERRAAIRVDRLAGARPWRSRYGASWPALQKCSSPVARFRMPANMVMNSISGLSREISALARLIDGADVGLAAQGAAFAQRLAQRHEQAGRHALAADVADREEQMVGVDLEEIVEVAADLPGRAPSGRPGRSGGSPATLAASGRMPIWMRRPASSSPSALAAASLRNSSSRRSRRRCASASAKLPPSRAHEDEDLADRRGGDIDQQQRLPPGAESDRGQDGQRRQAHRRPASAAAPAAGSTIRNSPNSKVSAGSASGAPVRARGPAARR